MEYKMKTVENLPDGSYIVNDYIKVENVQDIKNGQITYDIDYEEEHVSEEEAIAVSEDFINKVIKGVAIAAYEEQTEQYFQG